MYVFNSLLVVQLVHAQGPFTTFELRSSTVVSGNAFIDNLVLQDENGAKISSVSRTGSTKTFHLSNSSKELFKIITIKNEVPLPKNYYFGDVTIEIAVYDRYKHSLEISPFFDENLADYSQRLARELYATNISDLTINSLISFYQKARVVASERTKSYSYSSTAPPHAYDIQSVYKYLEACRFLSEKTYFIPNKYEFNKAIEWLDFTIKQHPSNVCRAVQNLANANQMVKQSKSNEAIRFKRYWLACDQGKDEEKYFRLKRYLSLYQNTNNNEDRKLIMEYTRIGDIQILEGLSDELLKNKNVIPNIIDEAAWVAGWLERHLTQSNKIDENYQLINQTILDQSATASLY